MKKLTLFAAMMVMGATTGAAAQQAAVPTPPKPVHPTPIPATGCRGCSDAITDKATNVKGYDDKSLDSTRRKAAVPAKKVRPKKRVIKHSAVKPKTSSKAGATKAKTSTATRKKPKLTDRPAVLDPMIAPHATVTKPKPDTTRK